MTLYQKLQHATNEVDGNYQAHLIDTRKWDYCSSCDCDYGHACLVCGTELDQECCVKHEGLCVKHWTLKEDSI